MNDKLAQQILELIDDGLTDCDWDYIEEAHSKLSRYLESVDALDRMADNARELGLDY